MPLLYIGQNCIIKINDEFILCEGINTILPTDTTGSLKILERDLFEIGETDIAYGQDVGFYKILAIQNKNGNIFTNTVVGDKNLGKYMEWDGEKLIIRGEVQIGGNTGRINFTDSNMILDDISLWDSTYRGLIIQDETLEEDKEIFYVARNNNNNNFTELTLANGRKYLSSQIFTEAGANGEDITIKGLEFIGATLAPIPVTVRFLRVGDNTSFLDNLTTNQKMGMLSTHNNHLYWHNGTDWVQIV